MFSHDEKVEARGPEWDGGEGMGLRMAGQASSTSLPSGVTLIRLLFLSESVFSEPAVFEGLSELFSRTCWHIVGTLTAPFPA